MKTMPYWKSAGLTVVSFFFLIFLLFLGGLFFSMTNDHALIFDYCLRVMMLINLLVVLWNLFSDNGSHDLIPLAGVSLLSCGLTGVFFYFADFPYYSAGIILGLLAVCGGFSQLRNKPRDSKKVFVCLASIFFLQTMLASFLAWNM